ncbi:MAG: hypothetical protein ACTSYD_13610 [Candidatus Heimdallarchaeaceae archaeon]
MPTQNVENINKELNLNIFEDKKFISELFSSPGRKKIYKSSYQYFSEKIHGIPKKISEYLNAFNALIKNYSEEFEETEVIITEDERIFGEIKGLSYVGTKEKILPGYATWPKDHGFIGFLALNLIFILLWMLSGILVGYYNTWDAIPFFALAIINIFVFIVGSIYILLWYKSHPTRLKHGYDYFYLGEFLFIPFTFAIYMFYFYGVGDFDTLIWHIISFFGLSLLDIGLYVGSFFLFNRVGSEMAATGMSTIWFRFSAKADFGNLDIVNMDPEKVLELVPNSLFFEYHLALDVKRISQISADVVSAKATFLRLKKQVEEICKGKTI